MGFAPEDLGFIADPYPVYERLRTRAPVHRDDATDHWLVARHDDVNALLRDRRLGRTYHHVATDEEMGRPPADPSLQPFWHLIEHGILDMEPPTHTRVRRLVSKAFTPRMVEGMRAPIQRPMDGLVDAVQGPGTFDLIPTIAEPLPVAVIAELLGTRHPTAASSVPGPPTSAACTSSIPRRMTSASRYAPVYRSPSTCARCRAIDGRTRRATSSASWRSWWMTGSA